MKEAPAINEAILLQSSYQPSEAITGKLQGKALVMIVGPVAIGKTSVMNSLSDSDSRFGRVSVFTTREPRADDDPGMFRVLPHDEEHITAIMQKIDSRELVQFAVHPTSYRFYGSELADYSSEYNMLATLSDAVETMATLPFKRVYIVGLVTDPSIWAMWLTKRYPAKNKDLSRRLKEAIRSLDWLLHTRLEVIWAHNTPGEPGQAAEYIRNAILHGERDDGAKSLAYELRKKAEELYD